MYRLVEEGLETECKLPPRGTEEEEEQEEEEEEEEERETYLRPSVQAASPRQPPSYKTPVFGCVRNA